MPANATPNRPVRKTGTVARMHPVLRHNHTHHTFTCYGAIVRHFNAQCLPALTTRKMPPFLRNKSTQKRGKDTMYTRDMKQHGTYKHRTLIPVRLGMEARMRPSFALRTTWAHPHYPRRNRDTKQYSA